MLRAPADPLHAAQFLCSAAYSQRNFLAAQFLLFLANWDGPQGWDPGPGTWDSKEGPPQGMAQGPKGQGANGPMGRMIFL